MRTSVIIVNWNGLHHLEHCLPALAGQTLKPDEIIVVDNASSDGSVAYLKTNYPEIRLVELDENRGFSGGNIAGYELASGDYIVLLNNDTKPLPDWLEHLVRCADDHPEVGIVAAFMTDWEGLSIDTAGDMCSVTGHGYHKHHGLPISTPLQSDYIFSACAGSALYKRAMINTVGFLDVDFFMNVEDTDLSFRAQLSGWEVYFCAESVVRHRISGSQGSLSKLNVFFNSRNQIRMYVKCMPTALIYRYFPLFMFEKFKLLLFYAQKNQGIAYLKGIVSALSDMRSLLTQRQKVLEGRSIANSELEQKLISPPFLHSIFNRLSVIRKSRN